MTNQDFIREYIKGEHRYGAYCHLGYADDKLINYSTVICRIDRENKTALVNNRSTAVPLQRYRASCVLFSQEKVIPSQSMREQMRIGGTTAIKVQRT